MSQRVLSTDQALAAAVRMRSLLHGSLQEDLQRLREYGRLLSDPVVWDSPEATRFRTEEWPRSEAAVDRALRLLADLQDHTERINRDILAAGGDGGGGRGAIFGEAAGGIVAAAPPPAPDARVRQALAYFHQHLHGGNFLFGDQGDLEGIDAQLKGMTPEEINEFLAALSPQDLQDWNKQISSSGGFLFHQDGLSLDDRLALGDTLLASADAEQLARLHQYLPALEPTAAVAKVNITGWQPGGGLPLYDPTTGRPEPAADINQGQDGDCFFMSSLGAVAEQHPDLITQNIHANPNGTYTVTFYRDGHPTQVTVTDEFPSGPNGWNGYAFAHTSGDGAKWAMIYEKAYAEFRGGGYGDINGGNYAAALQDLTGSAAVEDSPKDHSLADIQAKLQQGYAITSGTPDHWPQGGEMENSPGGDIVADHGYFVQSVDTTAHPPTITLVNPWGAGSGAPQFVTLTEAEWHQYFTSVDSVRMGS